MGSTTKNTKLTKIDNDQALQAHGGATLKDKGVSPAAA